MYLVTFHLQSLTLEGYSFNLAIFVHLFVFLRVKKLLGVELQDYNTQMHYSVFYSVPDAIPVVLPKLNK